MKHFEDVAIVGGGPSGAFCALELAKQGIYATIFDHSYPREKPCGGGISPPIIEQFPIVETFRPLGFTFSDFRIISCAEIQVVTKRLAGGFCISRQLFDEGILNIALENGAKLVKEKVIDVTRERSGWRIKTNRELYSARILVGADGVNSIVRRNTVGAISKENLALTFGYKVTSIKQVPATIKYLGVIPGYIWVFPGKNYFNVGIGSELKYGSRLKRLLDDFIISYCPDTKIISMYAAILPSAKSSDFFSLPCAGDNWILIGDAAGHVDPVSGGGILYALWGGKLGAFAIKNKDLKSYDNAWRSAYGKKLVESCNRKEDFYDPGKSTASILLGLVNKVYTLSPT
ncbi:MAG TPA: geranylgeranyl reductase family protein [Candidatus Nanoarchaeia archaeon]|nr:geranylgeranyl reductase family protein [Candidatus Nanoarchaeia archaeon]